MTKVVLTLLVIFAFYVTRLRDVITYDEVYTYYGYAYNPLVALLSYTLPNNHQLHSVMVWLSTSLIGDSVIAIRLPAFYVSLLTLSMMYSVARRFYTSFIGWLLIILLAVHPLYIQYSVESRGYMLANLLLLILVACISRRNLHGKKRSYLVLLLCSGLMITLPTMIIAIVACVIWGMSFQHKRLYRQFVVIPAITGCIIGGMFYVSPLLQGLFSEFNQMFGYKSISEFILFFVSDFILVSPSAILSFILLLIGLLNYRKASQRPIHLLGLLTVTTILVVLIQFIVSGSIIYSRNLFFLIPVWILALGSVFEWTRYKQLMTIIAVLYLLGNLFWLTLPMPTVTDDLLEDISQFAEETDYLIFACCQDGPMRYELEHRNQIHLIDGRKTYNRVVIFSFEKPLKEMIADYNLDLSLDDCHIEDWNRFSPYICVVHPT